MSPVIEVLELVLIVSDYILLLVDPLVQRFLVLLNLTGWSLDKRTVKYQPQRPWLKEGELVPVSGGVGDKNWIKRLSSELQKYINMNKSMIEDTNGARLEALRSLQEYLSLVWPWAEVQAAPVDELERHLCWRNYDLCIVDDDWDLCGFLKALNPASEASSLAHKQEWAPRVKLIYSFPETRISAIRVEAEGNRSGEALSTEATTEIAGEPTSNLNASTGSILCVRLMSSEECQLNNVRSSLVFHYSQREPQLSSLYLMVSRLLELAGGLIELSSDGLASEALLKEVGEGGGGGSGRVKVEKVEGAGEARVGFGHKSCVSGVGSSEEANNNKDEVASKTGERLSRYALVLILVAYLNSESATKLKAKASSQERLLTLLLADFLASYARLASQLREGCHRVIIHPTNSARSMAIRMMAPPPEEASSGVKLEILDPASATQPNDFTLAGLAKQMAHYDHGSLINLTKTLPQTTFDRLLELMERLSVRVSTMQQGLDKPEENSRSQLELLFIESQQFALVNPRPTQNIHTCTLSRYANNCTGDMRLKKSGSGWEELKVDLDFITFGLFGKMTGSPCKVRPKRFRGRRTARGRLLWNLLYLVMFLLLRDALSGRLSKFKSSLESSRNEDWSTFKSSFLNGRDEGDFLRRQHSSFGVEAVDVTEQPSTRTTFSSPIEEQSEEQQVKPAANSDGTPQVIKSAAREDKQASVDSSKDKAEDEIVSEKEPVRSDSTHGESDDTSTPNDVARKDEEEKDEEKTGPTGMDVKEFMAQIMQAMMQEMMESGDMDMAKLMEGLNQGEGGGEGIPADWAKNFDPSMMGELLKGMKRNVADNPGEGENAEGEDEEEEEKQQTGDEQRDAEAQDGQEEGVEASTLSSNIDAGQSGSSDDSSSSRSEL